MKKLFISAAFLIVCNVHAGEIKTAFIPHVTNQPHLSGVYGQDDQGGFVCYGTITAIPKMISAQQHFTCSGKKITIASYVKDTLPGTYIGSTLLYANPVLPLAPGRYAINPYTPGITGIMFYYHSGPGIIQCKEC